MTQREKYLIGVVVILVAAVVLVCVLASHSGNSGKEDFDATDKLEKTSLKDVAYVRKKSQKASGSGKADVIMKLEALNKKMAELELEIAALKRGPTSEEKLAKSMFEVERRGVGRQRFVAELKKVDPEKSFEIFKEVWPTVESESQRISLIRAFSTAKHPHLLEIIDYGVNDPSRYVQSNAFELLSRCTLENFEHDIEAYKEWRENTKGMTLDEMRSATVAEKFEEAYSDDDNALRTLLGAGFDSQFRDYIPTDKALALCEYAINRRSYRGTTAALDYLYKYEYEYGLSDPYLRSYVAPLLINPDKRLNNEDIKTRAAKVLATAGKTNAWATETLMGVLDREFENDHIKKQYYRAVAHGVWRAENYDVVPKLIEVMKRDPEDAKREISNAGLGQLTGVRYHYSHDGEWWEKWWENNKSRFQTESDE